MTRAGKKYGGPCRHCGASGVENFGSNGARGSNWQFRCKQCGRANLVSPEFDSKAGAGSGPEQSGVEENGNYAEAVSDPVRDSRTVPTVASVLKQFGVDTNVWSVERHLVNRWEMGFKDGDGEPGHYPLFQVKIWLVRKEPIAVEWPQIAGARVKPIKPRKFSISRNLKRRIILPDMQVGFKRDFDTGELTPLHDPLACDVFLQVVKSIQPDGVDAVGDNLDLPHWTDKFITTPEFFWTTQASIDWLGSWLAECRRHVGPFESDDEFRYLEGNHEIRLFNSIVKNLIAAYRLRPANEPRSDPVFSIPFLLGLRQMKISWHNDYPKNRVWINDNLRVSHAGKLANKSGQSAGKSLEGARASMLFGHSHRLESAHVTVHARDKIRVYGAYNVGTLARVDGIVPSNAAEENWQQGFAIVDYQDSGNQLFQVQLINIYSGRCIVDGRAFEAEC